MTNTSDPGDDNAETDRRPHHLDFFGRFGEALIALFYVGGSIMFFNESTSRAGVWLFLIGSLVWLARPLIGMARDAARRKAEPPS